jgi:hypothetical protein
MVLVTLGCSATVGWSSRSDEMLSGRTPAGLAAACHEIGGMLSEELAGQAEIARSSCTVANGDAITCDWQAQRCITECTSSEQECATVRDLGYVPICLRPERSPTCPDATPDVSPAADRVTAPAT